MVNLCRLNRFGHYRCLKASLRPNYTLQILELFAKSFYFEQEGLFFPYSEILLTFCNVIFTHKALAY